jgi:hypothetical protein
MCGSLGEYLPIFFVISGLGVIPGIVLICFGAARYSLARRALRYEALFRAAPSASAAKVAAVSGRHPAKFMFDMRKMIYKGYFAQSILDERRRENADPYKPNPPAGNRGEADAVIAKGWEYIAKLSAVEADEKDLEVRAKIRAAREAATAVFEFVDENPEAAARLRRFMEYQMPEAVKLISTYDAVSDKNIKTDSMNAAVEAVLSALDAIVSAMRKQLDDLYADLAVNTKADADVYKSFSTPDGGDFK